MQGRLLIYGATGYTGRLIARAALERGLEPVLCGRHPARLAALSERLGGLEHRVATLGDASALDAVLADVDVLLNAAGPFSQTAAAVLDACLRTGTHYLDVTGEAEVMEALSRRDREAREREILVLPGAGFDVVPSDCLAAHVARRAPGATWLALGVRGLVHVTRGSYRTLVEQAGRPVWVRRDGHLRPVAPGSLRRTFDYDGEPCVSLAVSWGDVVSAWHTTGIPNIEVYFEAAPAIEGMLTAGRLFGGLFRTRTARVLLKAPAELLAEGPSPEERDAVQAVIVAEAGHEGRRLAHARLRTPEAYSFTGMAAALVAERVLQGDWRAGFRTPAGLFGPDFVTQLPGVERSELEAVH
ncbi:MAG: saccharopine dehydrogenase NADP-binding domain-containing protein [Myxococcota bacterium]|nr:saccharopine dehydrogenase NADP-binding domain-containing protein [Myxococcota bacterium]